MYNQKRRGTRRELDFSTKVIASVALTLVMLNMAAESNESLKEKIVILILGLIAYLAWSVLGSIKKRIESK